MDRETLRLEILRIVYRPNVASDVNVAQCRDFEAYILEPEKRKPGRPPKAGNADSPSS